MFQAEGIVRMEGPEAGGHMAHLRNLKECCEFKEQTHETERSVISELSGWPWALLPRSFLGTPRNWIRGPTLGDPGSRGS